MNVIACVKQVAQICVDNGYDSDTQGLVSDGLIYIINPYDEIAVEEAIRMREKAGRGHVTVISLGPSRVDKALRWCLALGADDAIHIIQSIEESLDPWSTASVLTDLIKDMHYDVLLFGKKAIDDEWGQVGTFVAELLGIPVVTSVSKIDVTNPGRADVLRTLDRGNREQVQCPVPAVLTVEKGLNRPRYPTFPGRRSAKRYAIRRIEINTIENRMPAKLELVRLAPPKITPKKILSVDSSMSSAARINFLMTGGMGQKKGGAVGGDTGQMISSIINLLKEKKMID